MCGIAGTFGQTLPPPERLSAASAALAHRGPDGEGVYIHRAGGNATALVHRRLAIIDLNMRSDQPFRLEHGLLCYNGELYNYVELKCELEALGYSFRTSGDTEVLARALLHWGPAALERCEGMWAFAWYDEKAGTLLLSRDRFGEKPLYLRRQSGVLYFASEIKGLAALAGAWPTVNRDHVLRYMVNGYKALNKVSETFYEGVTELPAGSYLLLKLGGEAPVRYWTPRPQVQPDMSYAEATARTREALIEAVRLRLRADVPLAFCMSGGIDSNALIAIAKRVLNCDVHGFTIVNTDARYEEQALVDLAVKDLGIRHTAIPVTSEDFLSSLTKLVAAHDAPVATISYYVHWQLMKAIAAHGYKVTISGTAADELFTGYYDHHNLYLAEMADSPEHAPALAAWREHQAPIVRNPHLQDPDLFVRDRSFREHIYLNNDVFASWLRNPWHEDFSEKPFHQGLLRNRMLNELFEEAVPVILKEDDLNAMYFSMENRSPFLDSKLFDTAYSIPERHLVRNGRAKAVLRDAMRGLVPDAVLDNRRKVGFNAPILELVDVRDPDVRAWLLDDGPIYDLVRKEPIEDLLRNDVLPNSASKFLFYFLNAKIFLETRA
jgi:asparagine synthase (glutamine-hydrolysing)